jgi:hypothetical protein
MRIRIYNIHTLSGATKEELGLKFVEMSLPSTFDVVDDKKFFLAVIKYGIKFERV